MAANSQYSIAARNAAANARAALLNNGIAKGYSGTQPATADTALSGNTLLGTLTFGATAFGAAVSGVVTANAITNGTAVATGTVTFFRLFESDGTTVVCDVNAAAASACVIMNSVAIQQGATMSITSMTLTESASGT